MQLTNAYFTMSNGTGIVVYNPVGVVNITITVSFHTMVCQVNIRKPCMKEEG